MKKVVIAIILLLVLTGCNISYHKSGGFNKTISFDKEFNYNSEINGKWIESDGFKGYLAEPKEKGNYPGIIMIHEWWGLNQNIMDMADELAGKGYTVIAVDLYDGRVAENSDDARTYATEVRENTTRAIQHMKAAKKYLEEKGSQKIASMGWCFGGGMSMQLSLEEPLDATVIYYGTLESDKEKLKTISWPVLGIFGAEDQSIPVEEVNNFEKSLNDLGIENEIEIYPELGHAFANPSNPGHDPKATEDAWEKTVNFLNTNLK